MTAQTLPAQDLLRRAIIEVASLPEKDLLIVLNVVADLKQPPPLDPRARVAEIRAHAQVLAAEMQGLSREELFRRFFVNLEEIRTHAIANGTATDGEADWVKER